MYKINVYVMCHMVWLGAIGIAQGAKIDLTQIVVDTDHNVCIIQLLTGKVEK